MKNPFKVLLTAAIPLQLLLLSGCANRAISDYDSAAMEKMRTYECFRIDDREARSQYQDVVLSPIVDRRIERSIESHLIDKGYKSECASTDFLITFDTVTKTKTEINQGFIGPSTFRRYPSYGYNRYSQIEIEQYEEGTFIIDIIDNNSKELVWRGTYVKRLGWSAPSDEDIDGIIGAILDKFPPEVGSNP